MRKTSCAEILSRQNPEKMGFSSRHYLQTAVHGFVPCSQRQRMPPVQVFALLQRFIALLSQSTNTCLMGFQGATPSLGQSFPVGSASVATSGYRL